jgi:hypothetical protein
VARSEAAPVEFANPPSVVSAGGVLSATFTVAPAEVDVAVFHIHQTDFQVVEVNGRRQPFTGYQDTVSLPLAKRGRPGEVKIIVPFTNPVSVGKFVYHCHIVQHADTGMMANLELVDPASPASPAVLTPRHH